ncbi:MAG: Asd/ArgC dimerization domain-containing protein [Acidobacteriaceae bacterium]|jgi:aspartate-semialdehyde dehydrogenase
MTTNYRIAIVGAASIRGKQLNEALSESSFAAAEFLLLDDQQALGQLEAVGDEITFIQPITADSFERIDFTFFAGAAELTRLHWQAAQRAGSSLIDLSAGLEGEAGVLVCAPWVQEAMGETSVAGAPNLHTPAVVSAHPAALVLALLLERLQRIGAIRQVSATVMEPASEYGRPALDELHQQTVALLSFQSIPTQVYDVQVAFNTVAAFGDAAKINLADSEARIRRHYALLSGGRLPQLSLQLIHAPVFHGHTFSIAVEYERTVTLEQIEATLSAPHVEVVLGDADAPGNLNSIGDEDVSVRVRFDEPGVSQSKRLWLWASADNLELSALNAVECAQELRKLRPQGTVQ